MGDGYWIGYQVAESESIPKAYLEDGLDEYLCGKVGDGFRLVKIEADVYIVMEDPFEDGSGLTAKKNALDDELKRLELKQVGCFRDSQGDI